MLQETWFCLKKKNSKIRMTKVAWYWLEHQCVDQQNGTEQKSGNKV